MSAMTAARHHALAANCTVLVPWAAVRAHAELADAELYSAGRRRRQRSGLPRKDRGHFGPKLRPFLAGTSQRFPAARAARLGCGSDGRSTHGWAPPTTPDLAAPGRVEPRARVRQDGG